MFWELLRAQILAQEAKVEHTRLIISNKLLGDAAAAGGCTCALAPGNQGLGISSSREGCVWLLLGPQTAMDLSVICS